MKKILFTLLALVLLMSGCSGEAKSDSCDFLIEANWEGIDEQCVNVITFKEDFGFTNWCYCGSPVGDGDLIESFAYNDETKEIYLYDSNNKLAETAKILYCDDMYLIIDIWGETYVYNNLEAKYLPTYNEDAALKLEDDGTTKPCLTVLGLENNNLIVSSYNYDGDAKDSFETWKLPISEDIIYTNVSVTIENDIADVTISPLSNEDEQYIGEYYTGGFLEFDTKGCVDKVTFYGELIIY